MTPRSEGALYVYALLPDRPGAADGVTGLDGRPLRTVAAPGTGIAALVHDASPVPYQGSDEEVRRWIVEQDRAVVTVWERTGTVLPMTFNVLVAADGAEGLDGPGTAHVPGDQGNPDMPGGPGDPSGAGGAGGAGRAAQPRSAGQRLLDWIGAHAAELTPRLEALADRAELRVEITIDRAEAVVDDERARSLRAEMAGRSPGLRRMLEKRLEQLRTDASEQLADALHAEVRRRLAAVAEDLRDRGRTVRDRDEADVFSAALLVDSREITTVGTVLAGIQEAHPAARIRFLGPWPPYSFAELPSGPTDGDADPVTDADAVTADAPDGAPGSDPGRDGAGGTGGGGTAATAPGARG